MGLKEIEEEVVERCRVGSRKLRSARRVTVFWCFDGTKYLSEIGAREGAKFTDDFLHYSQRHFGVLLLRRFVCCGSPRVAPVSLRGNVWMTLPVSPAQDWLSASCSLGKGHW